MILFKVCLTVCLIAPSLAVVNKNEKREAPFGKYGPPVPHRTYGVPQQLPFREYGPPPSKLKFGSAYGGGYKNNHIHEQIVKVVSAPKPEYGPPHQKQPQIYGPPQHKPFTNYGPPPKPHRPPPKLQYGPPKRIYGPPPKPFPHFKPGPLIKPAGIIHTSYGPPALPVINHGIPPSQLVSAYDLPPATSYGVPETPLLVSGTQQGGVDKLPVIESQSTHFGHSGCDGWKPISAPAGQYVEHNAITETTGYSNVAVNGAAQVITSAIGADQPIPSGPGIPDEQLVAIALQSSQNEDNLHYSGANIGGVEQQIKLQQQPEIFFQQLPLPIPPPQFHIQAPTSFDTANLVSSVDSYSRPPPDSYAPNSIHALKYEKQNEVKIAIPNNLSGSIPHQTNPVYENYGPPPLPQISQSYGSPKQSGYAFNNIHPEFTQQLPLTQPLQEPVAYRPPVPTGLIENIGATVEHDDTFGVNKAKNPQLNTYIPPHINELPLPQQQVIVQVQEQSFGHQQQQQHLQFQNFEQQIQQQQQHQQFEQQHQQFEHQQFEQQHQQLGQQLQSQQYEADIQSINTQNCGHGPNLAGYNNIVTGGYSIGEQQYPQFIQQPATSYGPPASGHVSEKIFVQKPINNYELPPLPNQVTDISGYESKQSPIIASLPGLEGLNVLAAQKSEGVQLSEDNIHRRQTNQKFEVRTQVNDSNNADNIISEDLIQKVLSAVEEKPKKDAQSRSDNEIVDETEHIESNDEKSDTERNHKNE